MYDYKNKITIEYDPKIISKIKEMISEDFKKLESFIKLKSNEKTIKNQDMKLFYELNQSFEEISLKLKELELCYEYNYFLPISDYILYIVHQNSIDSTFGHCDFTIELFDFFMELFKTNLKFYNSQLESHDDEFRIIQQNFKEQYWNYRSEFYCNIYESSGTFSDKEMYEIHKSLRG